MDYIIRFRMIFLIRINEKEQIPEFDICSFVVCRDSDLPLFLHFYASLHVCKRTVSG